MIDRTERSAEPGLPRPGRLAGPSRLRPARLSASFPTAWSLHLAGLLRLVVLIGPVMLLGPAGEARAIGDRGADGDFERRDSFHFTLYQDVDIDRSSGFSGSRRFEQEVLDRLEEAFDRLDRILDLRPEDKLVVYVWDPALFDARYAGLFRFPAAGFYGGSIHIRGDTRVTRELVRVLHHELVHAAFDAEAPRLVLPAWMNEGIAEWFEARAGGKRRLSTAEHGALVELAGRGALFRLAELSGPSFGGLATPAASVAYLQSYGFIDYLVQQHGERDLVRFWSAVLRSRKLDRSAQRVDKRVLRGLEEALLRSLGAG